MSEMVERVARAICRSTFEDISGPDLDVQVDACWHFWEDAARVAIEAMREAPVITTALFRDPVPSDFVTFAELLWDRMIDAALREP